MNLSEQQVIAPLLVGEVRDLSRRSCDRSAFRVGISSKFYLKLTFRCLNSRCVNSRLSI